MESKVRSLSRKICNGLAKSPALHWGKHHWELNQKNRDLPLTKIGKIQVGLYIILKDYAVGDFPPKFEDQTKAYEAEINSHFNIPGRLAEVNLMHEMRKPFWFSYGIPYIKDFLFLIESFRRCSIRPNSKILELGCGSGWMSEFFALMGFSVFASTISEYDIQQVEKRIASLDSKQIPFNLRCCSAPMESVDKILKDELPFDVVVVYEALHHAYDWQKTLEAAYASLENGGWFFICKEPNVMHTFVSYRLAKITNTHEIGMSRQELESYLSNIGFQKIIHLKHKFNWLFNAHWIAAQK